MSASGKIRRTKGKAKPAEILVPKDYFERNMPKFREFKIKKGKKISTPNSFIEKRGKRLDTRREVRKITLAKLL